MSKIITLIEDQIKEMTKEERLANLKPISYFIQCAAMSKKISAAIDKDANPLNVNVKLDFVKHDEPDESPNDVPAGTSD